MKDEKKENVIYSKFWEEEPESDNPFASKAYYCYGYDVYGDLLGKASYFEFLYLLFKGERPTKSQAQLLEGIAFSLANPGPRDHSVLAAMTAGASSATMPSSLISAIACGSGNLGGYREILTIMEYYNKCGLDIEKWKNIILSPPKEKRIDSWGYMEHIPGFDPHGVSCTTPVLQVLNHLAGISDGKALNWLHINRQQLEKEVGYPLTLSSVVAAAFVDLEFNMEEAGILYLILRLPGAAVHSLEQANYTMKRYPFYSNAIKLLDNSDAGREE